MIIFIVGFSILILLVYIYYINIRLKHFPPGPISLPIIGGLYALGTQPHKAFPKLMLRYGKIIGIDLGNYRAIVLNDQKLIKEALDLTTFNGRPQFELYKIYRKNASGIILNEGEDYYEQRHFLVKILRKFGVGTKSMETLILSQLENIYKKFDQNENLPMTNGKNLFMEVAVRSLWKIITGETDPENEEEFKSSLEAGEKLTDALSSTSVAFFCPELYKLLPNISGWNQLIEYCKTQNDLVRKLIEKHKLEMKDESEPKDLIEAYLQKMKSDNNPHSSFYGEYGEENLVGVVGDLLLAGSETVAVALNWAIVFLILNPDIQDKLYLEIVQQIGSASPSLNDKFSLPYVEAFILEIFRYTGFVPLASPHRAMDEIKFHGYIIPKGTIVIPNLYWVLNDPKTWGDPEYFRPERFLKDDGSAVLRNHSAHFVFGSGKRICPGEFLAKDELFLFITGLCQRYEFRVAPGSSKPTLDGQVGITLVPKPHLFICSKR